MQLVMQRFRLYSGLSGIWFRFRINVRLVLNEQEKHLLVVYSLKEVALTEGDMRRDLIRSALIAVPLAIILTFMTLIFRTAIFGLNIGTFMSVLAERDFDDRIKVDCQARVGARLFGAGYGDGVSIFEHVPESF